MALTSRRQREQEQRKRMLRGRRNLSQLAGPVSQGQRTPMNRGTGSVSTLQAPPFQQSNPGADITQAGLAFKGGRGIHDFAMGKEAYTDAAGNVVPERAPWSLGDKTISERIDQYGTDVSDQWNKTTEGLFGTSTPQPSATPTNMNPGANVSDINAAKQGGGDFGTTMKYGVSPKYGPNNMLSDMSKAPIGLEQELAAGGNVDNLLDVGAGNMSSGGSGASNLSGLLGGGTHASQLGNVYAPAGSFGTTGGSVLHQGGGSLGGTSAAGGEAVAGADAASGASGQPWMAYANIAKDLFVGGPGSEKITGSTAGDAAIRAAAAYFTFGLSEIPYALF